MTGLAAARPRTVETSRLCLRPPRPGDASALAAMAADWEVAKAADWEVAKQTAGLAHPYGLADAEDWIDAAEGAFGEGGARWVIERTSDGSVIGTIGFGGPEPHDMGFWLGQEHWGRGYATEAVTARRNMLWGRRGSTSWSPACLPRTLPRRGFWKREGSSKASPMSAIFPPWRPPASAPFRAHRPVKLVIVAAAALLREGNVLLTERPSGKTMAGLWEFPGGKVGPGETPEQALVRELEEELGLEVQEAALSPLIFASHRYQDFHLLMPLFTCRTWQGEPQAREGQAIAWVPAAELGRYPMPPADEPLVAAVQAIA